MGINVRDSHLELYTPIYDEFMLGVFNEYAQVCEECFTIYEDKTKAWLVNDLSGLGSWDETSEAEAGETEDPVLGWAKTYTHTKFTKTFTTSYEAIDDDEYALLKKTGQAEEMGVGGRDRVERQAAAVLINGFASTVNSPDGQYLFDTDHPKNREETGTTYDNLLTGAFTHDNLESAENQIVANMFDMKDIPIPITQTVTLLHPPAIRGSVDRVLNERAWERPGSTNRDINRFTVRTPRMQYNPVEWVYLSAALGGSDTAWFLCFKWLKKLKLVWREYPRYVSWRDDDTELYYFKGRMRFSVGADNWRGAFASTGS